MGAAAVVALVAFIIILWRRRYIYLIFIAIPLAYILSITLPSKEVCVKEVLGFICFLCPMEQFLRKLQKSTAFKRGGRSQKDEFKVQLQDQR